MKIRYLDGKRLYYAVLAGGKAVIADQAFLNRINVFPVADADTGTNMASTMRAIARRAKAFRSPKETLSSIADAALAGARGNSGIIFAQFLVGLSRELKQDFKLSTRQFAEAVKRAVPHARQAVASPAEGTILSVMDDWAECLYRDRHSFEDYTELLSHSLKEAERSLKETSVKLSALAKASVVDAGARGFFDFIQGIMSFIGKGDLKEARDNSSAASAADEPLEAIEAHDHQPSRRYCTEAFISGEDLDLGAIRKLAEGCGNSVVVAGGGSRIRVHLHTDKPAGFFEGLAGRGRVLEVKVDDMKRQYEAAHDRLGATALLTDSTCDIPQETLDRFQIHVAPYSLSFGDETYLDRLSLESERFYDLLDACRELPRTGQPNPDMLRKLLDFLTVHYRSVLAFTMSSGLSGEYGQLKQMASSLYPDRMTVVDSRQTTAGLGLMVIRAAEALNVHHRDAAEVAAEAAGWPAKLRLYTDIKTLKYMVMGGRVPRAKGVLASLLRIKPIISINEEGKAVPLGKSFTRNGNMDKIIRMAAEESGRRKVWNYAIVHGRNPERARLYAEKLEKVLGKPPLFINTAAPALGVHSGTGVIAVAVMYE